MKNILIVLAAVALLLLGWYLWSGPPISDTDLTPSNESDAGKAREDSVGENQRGDRSDREVVDSPKNREGRKKPKAPKVKEADPSLGALHLKVVYAKSRKPAARVALLVLRRAMAWDEQQVYRTGGDGQVLIESLQPGNVYVKALRGGENRFTIFAGKTKSGVLKIPSGTNVYVEVVDGDGASVGQASVWVSERWRDNRGAIAGKTDDLGKVRLEHVSPNCNLAVRCRGFEPSRLHRIRGDVGSTVRLRITLKRGGGMIDGIVVDQRGDPVKRAFVLIGAERPDYSHRGTDGSWTPGAPPVSILTGKDGRFAADATPFGKLRIQVRHPEFAPWSGDVEAQPGAPASQRIVLSPGAVLFGKVTDSRGQDVAFARISVGSPFSFAGRTEFADRFGKFELRGLGSGEQKAHAVKGTAEAEETVRIAVGERVEWNPVLDETLDSGGKKLLVGRVVDHRSQPLYRWRVAAHASGEASKTVSGHTDREGRFRLAVEWDVLRVWTHAPGKQSEFPALIRDGVQVSDGELVLRVDDPSFRVGEVHGLVVDSVGRAVQAQIQTWHHEAKLWREFKTDAKDGGFRIENIPPGKIDLKVTSSDHPWRTLPVQTIVAGQSTDLGRIVMESGGRIEGSLRLVGGVAPKKVKISIYYDKGGEAGVAEYTDGKFRSGVLSPGTYVFFAMGDRFASLEVKFSVTAGSTTTKNFSLQPAAVRTLKFVMAQGAKRPRFLSVNVRSKKGKLVFYFSMDSSEELQGNVSLLPGEYVVRVWGPENVSWLTARLTVADFAAADPITYTIRPTR